MRMLEEEIVKFRKKAEKVGLIPVVRLNGTSDIDWNFYYWSESEVLGEKYKENMTIFQVFPNVQFYDYTKDTRKIMRKQPPNYHLVYSYNENSQKDFCYDLLHEHGINVSVVYDHDTYLKAIEGGAIDGDYNDLRFNDNHGKIVALEAKGRAKKDKTGFVMRGGL
jgi:hypothetical protein